MKFPLKNYIIVVLVLASVFINGCGSNVSDYAMDPNVDVTVFSNTDYSSYQYLEDNDPAFQEISFSDALKFFQNNWSGVIYFGKSGCRFCQRAVPVLNKAAKDCNITVYYVDSAKSLASTEQEVNELYNEMSSYISDSYLYDENNVLSFYVPNVIGVHNGVMKAWKVSLADDYDINKADQMNEKQKEELYQDYLKVFAGAYSDQ